MLSKEPGRYSISLLSIRVPRRPVRYTSDVLTVPRHIFTQLRMRSPMCPYQDIATQEGYRYYHLHGVGAVFLLHPRARAVS